MRVVIDTDAWISRLLLADSVAARAVDSGKSNRVALGRCRLMTVDRARRQAALTDARIRNREDLEPKPEPERYVAARTKVPNSRSEPLNPVNGHDA